MKLTIGDVIEHPHLDSGTIQVQVIGPRDRELGLWRCQVVMAQYDDAEDRIGNYYEGRTGGLSIAESAVDGDDFKVYQ